MGAHLLLTGQPLCCSPIMASPPRMDVVVLPSLDFCKSSSPDVVGEDGFYKPCWRLPSPPLRRTLSSARRSWERRSKMGWGRPWLPRFGGRLMSSVRWISMWEAVIRSSASPRRRRPRWRWVFVSCLPSLRSGVDTVVEDEDGGGRHPPPAAARRWVRYLASPDEDGFWGSHGCPMCLEIRGGNPPYSDFWRNVVVALRDSILESDFQLSVQLEPVDLQVNVRSLAVALVERNQALDSMEARRIPGSHETAGCC
ncbi:hypothetical protein ACLOJK_006531 [Asimina triloba]